MGAMFSSASLREDAQANEVVAWRKLEARRLARQKLKEDKEKIERMALTSHKNGVNPEQIIPKEIWENILKKLKNPVDIDNAFKACGLFHDLLYERRCAEVLFPAVLEIVYPCFHKLDESRNIRGVCKAWKDGFDELAKKLEEKDDHFSLNTCLVPYLGPKDVTNPTRFEGLLKMSTSQSILRIDLLAEREHRPEEIFKLMIQEFVIGITSHLEAEGKALKYFLIVGNMTNLKRSGINYVNFYGLVRKWLSFTPGLTRLGLSFYTEADDDSGMKMLKEAVMRERPPRLKSLEQLELRVDQHINEWTSLFESIVRANPQIKSLAMDSCENAWNARKKLKRAVRRLKLKTLSMDVCHFNNQGLASLLHPDWKLESLIMDVNRTPTIDLKSLFRALKKYPSLKTLELNLVGSGSAFSQVLELPKFDCVGVLQLPNVSKLVLYLPEHYMTRDLDFIFPLAKLETLVVTYARQESFWRDSDESSDYSDYYEDGNGKGYESEGGRQPLVELNGHLELNAKSQVWVVFPFLKKVTIRLVSETEGLIEEKVYVRGSDVYSGY